MFRRGEYTLLRINGFRLFRVLTIRNSRPKSELWQSLSHSHSHDQPSDLVGEMEMEGEVSKVKPKHHASKFAAKCTQQTLYHPATGTPACPEYRPERTAKRCCPGPPTSSSETTSRVQTPLGSFPCPPTPTPFGFRFLNHLSSSFRPSKQSGSRSSAPNPVSNHNDTHPVPLRGTLFVAYLPLATGRDGDVDEAPRVQLALVGAALGGLGLLLGFDLGTVSTTNMLIDRTEFSGAG